jgi:hypothetical protein
MNSVPSPPPPILDISSSSLLHSGVVITTLSGLVCVIAATQTSGDGFLISASDAGLALTFALTLPGELNWMLRNLRLALYIRCFIIRVCLFLL